jgi:hypothetical protein
MANIDDKMASIDSAINSAKARRKNRAEGEEKVARVRKTPEERAASAAAKEEIRAAKKAVRDAKNVGKVVHMAKIEKAAGKLPNLTDEATNVLNEVTANFSQDQVEALAQHLLHFNRLMATKRSLATQLVVGQEVTIKTGRFAGQVGVVTKAQRIRCYVTLGDRELYLFNGDVESTNVVSEDVAV